MAKYDSIDEIEAGTNGAGLRIGIVVGALQRRHRRRVACELHRRAGQARRARCDDIKIVTVPGALEVPLALKRWPAPEDSTRWSRSAP